MHVERILLVAALVACAGCATVQPVQEPNSFFERANPEEVYVTFKNHSRVTLLQPRVASDSLYGKVAGISQTVSAPLSDVQRIEARQRDGTRTRWLIAGVGVVTAGLVFGMMQSGGNKWRHPCDTGTEDCNYGEYALGR